MTARKPPDSWFWSHDIEPEQITSVVTAGSRLVRLSSYGFGPARRFAALVYQEAGPARTWVLDLDQAALTAKLAEGAHAVGITVEALDDGPRFSVVLETGPSSVSAVHTDLDEAGVRALLDGHHQIVDLASYVAGGARKYAVIVEEREGPAWFLTGGAHDIDAKLLSLGAQLALARGNGRELAAVATQGRSQRWAWYADLSADGVGKQLESNDAYPLDLDATRDERGTHFTVVMSKA
ncbi:MAG TPA: hypothetical protein VGC42_13005 [Kofleriaceae bacterium]